MDGAIVANGKQMKIHGEEAGEPKWFFSTAY